MEAGDGLAATPTTLRELLQVEDDAGACCRPTGAAEMSREAAHLGFMYIARRRCGRITAMAWDDPGHEKSTAQLVARYIKRGDSVERVERFKGDPLPGKDQMICDGCRGKPCAALQEPAK